MGGGVRVGVRGGAMWFGVLEGRVVFFFMWGAVVGRVKAFPPVLVLGVRM